LNLRAVPNAKLGQPADPTGLAGNGFDFAPFPGAEQFQRHQRYHESLAGVHSY
jgi:hypothetical protein